MTWHCLLITQMSAELTNREAAVCTVITVGTLHMSRDRTRLLNFLKKKNGIFQPANLLVSGSKFSLNFEISELSYFPMLRL